MEIEFVAWWGAILSTGVLIWDVYKWHRERLSLRVRAVASLEGIQKGKLAVSISNRGSHPTTIEYLHLANHASLVPALLRARFTKESLFEADFSLIIEGETKCPLVLDPGGVLHVAGWLAGNEKHTQLCHEDLPKLVENGRLCVLVKCSQRDRPIVARIKPISTFDMC